MSVNRGQKLKNMFATPKTTTATSSDSQSKPPESEAKNDHLDPTINEGGSEDMNIDQTMSDSIPSDSQEQVTNDTLEPSPSSQQKDVKPKKNSSEETKLKKEQFFIGCRVSEDMKGALEDMAQDFAYLARKKYGLKIKDDSSIIQRAFLLLGMSCFTEEIMHKILHEYDPESPLQHEVIKQLQQLMRDHNVKINKEISEMKG